MGLFKVKGKKAEVVEETTFADAEIKEEQLEEWIALNPNILGEPLLFIGRQVEIAEIGDRIDLLGLDTAGNVVVVEVKRADIRAPVDIQGIRYASYVAGWSQEQLSDLAAGYVGEDADDFDLEAKFSEFTEQHGGDEEVKLNEGQRIIIVGHHVQDRLGSVALWLREQGVDIKLVEIHPFRVGDDLFLEPIVIIPPPSTDKWEKVGSRARSAETPWRHDGAAWHRQKYGEESFERMSRLLALLRERGLAD